MGMLRVELTPIGAIGPYPGSQLEQHPVGERHDLATNGAQQPQHLAASFSGWCRFAQPQLLIRSSTTAANGTGSGGSAAWAHQQAILR